MSIGRAHQALVDKGGETVQDVRGEIASVTHLLGGLEAPASGEDPEAIEEDLLVLGQKLVAPRDRSLERLLALGRISSPGGQQLEAVVETGEQGRGREQVDAGRSEL